jgi:phenylalanyl-tRNA synthetase beta subunit
MKSLAFAVQLQTPDRTLTESEVLELQTRMVAAVARDCDGQLREQ